jgi:acetyltransferase
VAAARSHTGAIAGSYPVLRAALRQGGVSEVHRSDELYPVASTLAYQPPVQVGKGVVIVSDGGGHGTLAADALQTLGVPLTTLTDDTGDRLRSLLRAPGALCNPIDLAGAADRDPEIFARVVELVTRDPGAGGVFVVGLFGGYAVRFAESLVAGELEAARGMIESTGRANLPLVVHTLYASHRTEPLLALGRAHVQVVRSVEIGSRCFRALHARGLLLAEQPVPRTTPTFQRTNAEAIERARGEGRVTLLEPEVRSILEQENVPLVPATFCRTSDELVRCISSHTPPFAIKVVSANISHKSEAGGVALDVHGADDARVAFERMIESVSHHAATRGIVPGIRGVLIMPMLPEPVAELLVGVKHDPHFGAVLTVGAGGVYVEVHEDIALRGLPVGRQEVLQMLAEIRLSKILNGYRGQPAADRDVLADLILGIAAAALSHPDIEELEANPVFAYADRAVVIDCRAFLKNGQGNGPNQSS